MQVESYQQRVQKYVEIAIERERNEPRPDVTEAMILIEPDWKHDGFSDDEDAPTHEWRSTIQKCLTWSRIARVESMESSSLNKAFRGDPETARAVEFYWKRLKSNGSGRLAIQKRRRAQRRHRRTPVFNKVSDWQTTGTDNDMCAYEYIQARFRGGIHLFAPKSSQPSRGQFARKRARLEPAPAYGKTLPSAVSSAPE